jgi:hypothetical protein
VRSCPTRLQLEAAVLGEAPGGRLTDYEAHADACPRCRHELNWLRSEVAMFSQRHAREEVSRLWEGVVLTRPARARRLSRMIVAVAASVLLALVASGGRARSAGNDEPLPMSLEMMSVDHHFAAVHFSENCFTPGFGIACGEP